MLADGSITVNDFTNDNTNNIIQLEKIDTNSYLNGALTALEVVNTNGNVF